MYLENYKLKEKPFQITADSRFLWLGDKHNDAFAILEYGILENKGFLLLTGDVGTGKTTLINALVKILGPEVIFAKISDPRLSEMDFFRFLAKEFSIHKPFQSKGEFINVFSEFLLQAHAKGKKVLIIADEAQRIRPSLLDEILHLSNIEKEHVKLLNIYFVGQVEFNNILLQKRNRAVRHRITVHYSLERLTEQETGEYIEHRLQVAGCTDEIFSKGAVHEIYKFSEGAPRLINIVCDRALLTGFLEGEKKIDAKMVAECAKELEISPYDEDESDSPPVDNTLVNTPVGIPVTTPDSTPADSSPDKQSPKKENEAPAPSDFNKIETIEIDLAGVRKKRGGSFSISLLFLSLVILIGMLCAYFFYL